MKSLKRLFYIYTEASMAVLMLIACLVELVCGLAVPGLGLLAFPASAAFLAIAMGNVFYIYRSERAKQ